MAVQDRPSPQTPIDPRTTVGAVRLTVRDLDRSRMFYEQLLGMHAEAVSESTVELLSASGQPLVTLLGSPDAAARDPHQPGLFHLALLYPTRRDLAVALVGVASARWPISGASDHLVSEALYLNDPEGNGIELYCDRDRSAWRFSADGEVEMDTMALDLDDLVKELEFEPVRSDARDRLIAAGTRMGHVHLQVSELVDTEEFYVQILGFDVMSRWRGQALFVSAGGYHHHIGLNTWNSWGRSAPAPGSAGLRSFDVLLPDEAALDLALGRVSAAGLPISEDDGGATVRDPSGNALLLRTPR